eukprot:8642905-Lingulodinium_polyedra.AAC.1
MNVAIEFSIQEHQCIFGNWAALPGSVTSLVILLIGRFREHMCWYDIGNPGCSVECYATGFQ